MKKILAIIAVAALAACQQAPAGFTPDPFAFEAKPPIRINVAEIKIVQNYKPSLALPNVEHDFPVPPEKAIRQWASKRLVAAGSSGVLEVVIDDASVKETKLPKTEGIKGLFTNDQEARYDANLNVTLRLFSGARALSDATGDILISRAWTMPENATIDMRTRDFHSRTREMLQTFDELAEQRLHQYFSKFMR